MQNGGARTFQSILFIQETGKPDMLTFWRKMFYHKLCPTPCVTRWGSFFACIKYHTDYYQVEADLVKNEKVLLSDRAPDLKDELCAVVNGDKWADTVLGYKFVALQRKY